MRNRPDRVVDCSIKGPGRKIVRIDCIHVKARQLDAIHNPYPKDQLGQQEKQQATEREVLVIRFMPEPCHRIFQDDPAEDYIDIDFMLPGSGAK
jgi:hypothetical protein